MDVALLFFLIILNGLFAMSEMSLAASRKARLQVMAESGDSGARKALDLQDNPTQFLSTVQIGITSIGVLNGIVGESAFSAPLAAWLKELSPSTSGPVIDGVSLALVVIIITFLTIIFGELVPKRIGQMFPESVARFIAQPMAWLSRLTKPFVYLLSAATQGVLKLLGLKDTQSRSVTSEEIAASLEEGLDAGVIEHHEHQMVRNVFRLDDRHIGSMMIPRGDIAWLDINEPADQAWLKVSQQEHSRYPVCRGGLDDVVGIVSANHLLKQMMRGEPLNFTEGLLPAVFVPETLTGMELLEHFRAQAAQMVFVVDEYGEVQGIITLRDVLEAITGEFTEPTSNDSWAVQRADGSWLIDGLIPIPEMKDRLNIRELPDEDRGRYNTLAGLVMMLLGRLPQTGDTVDCADWRFEVVDLDGKRVDKLLATRMTEHEGNQHE